MAVTYQLTSIKFRVGVDIEITFSDRSRDVTAIKNILLSSYCNGAVSGDPHCYAFGRGTCLHDVRPISLQQKKWLQLLSDEG